MLAPRRQVLEWVEDIEMLSLPPFQQPFLTHLSTSALLVTGHLHAYNWCNSRFF